MCSDTKHIADRRFVMSMMPTHELACLVAQKGDSLQTHGTPYNRAAIARSMSSSSRASTYNPPKRSIID